MANDNDKMRQIIAGRMVETFLSVQMLTKEDVAEILGVKPATLTDWLHDGKGPKAFRIGQGKGPVRYFLAEVQAWQRAALTPIEPTEW